KTSSTISAIELEAHNSLIVPAHPGWHTIPLDYSDALLPPPGFSQSPPASTTANRSAIRGHKSAGKEPASRPANQRETQRADNLAWVRELHLPGWQATGKRRNTPHWCWL